MLANKVRTNKPLAYAMEFHYRYQPMRCLGTQFPVPSYANEGTKSSTLSKQDAEKHVSPEARSQEFSSDPRKSSNIIRIENRIGLERIGLGGSVVGISGSLRSELDMRI